MPYGGRKVGFGDRTGNRYEAMARPTSSRVSASLINRRVRHGWSRSEDQLVLVGRDPDKLRAEAGKVKKGAVPPLWDGHAGDPIADVLVGQPSQLQSESLLQSVASSVTT